MSLMRDEKRGDWRGDVASLSNEGWNRQRLGNSGPQQTGTNNFANVDLIMADGRRGKTARGIRTITSGLIALLLAERSI
jgi:hypothetical protein